MSTRWKMGKSLKPSSTVSLHLARGPLAVHSCATKMSVSVTWEHSALITGNGRGLQLTMVGGDAFSNISSGKERTGSLAKLRKGEGEGPEESQRVPLGSQKHTTGDTAAGYVNPALVLSVTPNAAQATGLTSTRGALSIFSPDRLRPTTTTSIAIQGVYVIIMHDSMCIDIYVYKFMQICM